jgi:hypothetical protein
VTVEISTGSARVTLSDEECDELAQRLARFGAPDAAERLLGHHSIRIEDKPGCVKYSAAGAARPTRRCSRPR